MTVGRPYMIRKVNNYLSGGVPLAEALKSAGISQRAYDEALRIEISRPRLGTKKRASYMEAIAWIANNDAPGDAHSVDVVAGYLTTLLIADIFAKEPDIVAKAVVAYRAKSREG